MDPYKNQSFLKLALRFGLVFLVVVSIIKIVMSIFNTGSIQGMVNEYFSPETWQKFVVIQLVMSSIYGLFMAGYYKFIKKK
ncbi:hypothetical protein EC396_08405 [Lutibacter sp. HS1-25]|uniref:hypothetical protein n=1 Tax=Lutibacter sp. HS1-25 TaxID=2485000 RepID=UPI0010113362|nr:hypothetical protein [Lutibacter sp. HS1-25]RXP55505.1 hypothetical protein EC396_08405 [Lutibacter sp. HS1-25]